MIDAPQPTNRKLRRTAAEQADCPTATSVGAHIVRPGNPAAAQTPRATTTPTPEQAPLSKGAGRGASRGLGDCPATATTPEQADYPAATSVGADSISARPAAAQGPRATATPTAPADGQRPGDNPSDLAALGHLPLTREAGAPAATKRAKRGKRGKRRGKGDTTPPTPADIIKLRRRRCADAADIVSFFTKLVAMIALLAVLLGLAFGITPMPNDDMAPRISAGDLLLYYRLADDWANGDVMVFEKDGEQYVGRIVARGGDTVEVTDQATLVVNGSTVLENNIYYTTPKYENGPAYPLTLAAGEFFVLCDYREGARDSRYFGAVRPAEVKGKVITVVRRSGL